MNYNDEFESLIKNFKLDDAEEEPISPPSAPPMQPPAAVRQRAAAPDRSPAAATRRPPGCPSDQPPARPAGGGKDSFRVRIDEGKGYPPPSGGGKKPPPPRGGRPSRPPPEDDEPDSVLSGVNRWAKALVVLVAALGVSVFLAFFALASASDLFGLNKQDQPIEVELAEKLNMSQVAGMLKEYGVITQPLTFQLYVEMKSDAEDFIPGTYELNSNMSYDQIMLKFKSGNRQRQEVTILFYEGWTLKTVAQELEKEGVCDADELYNYLSKGDMDFNFEFLSQIPEDKNRFRRFEGYLFPDTYIFNKDEEIRQVALKFFSNFNTKMTDEMLQKMEERKMTLDEVITLASIIQREAATVEDMKMVSSVFQNRMAAKDTFPRLESDVTIFYVRDDIKPFINPNEVKLGEKDPNLPMYDSYNTYERKGLPIGPICNPGLDAINAVLEPAESEYYYFIADKDGVCHYAKTLAEHQKNIEEAGLNKGDGETHGTGTVSSEAAQ